MPATTTPARYARRMACAIGVPPSKVTMRPCDPPVKKTAVAPSSLASSARSSPSARSSIHTVRTSAPMERKMCS